MPALLPPELISHILSFLAPSDSLSVPTLVTCARVSSSFSTLALAPTLWTPHCLHRWSVRTLGDENPLDYYKRRAIVDNAAREEVLQLADGETERLKPLEVVVWKLGDEVHGILGKLATRKEAEGRAGEDEKWLSVRYWGRECKTALGRKGAMETWKQIMKDEEEGIDRESSFEEGVTAFTAFLDHDTDMVGMLFDTIATNGIISIPPPVASPPAPRETRKSAIVRVSLAVYEGMQIAGFISATPNDFHRLENHFLNLVFASSAQSSATGSPNRGTLPLTLVSIFCSLVSRLPASHNIQAKPIGFPGFVLAAVANRDAEKGREEWIYLNIYEQCKVMEDADLEALLRRNGGGGVGTAGLDLMRAEYLRPATPREMCLRLSRNIIHSVRSADERQSSDQRLTTSALYAAAMALFVLSPPEPNTAYANWMISIVEAEFPFDVRVLEELVLPSVVGQERRMSELRGLCRDLRERDREVKGQKIRKEEGKERVKWKCGHVFRHRLFGYVAVIIGWDGFCSASQEWIQTMQVDRLAGGRNQPFFHVLAEDQSTRYVAAENITCDESIEDADVQRLLRHRLIGKHFRTLVRKDQLGRPSFLMSKELEAEYPEG